MGIEIERKFLLKDDSWRTLVHSSVRLRQGYLNDDKACSIRVRTDDTHAWLNIKSVTIGASRQEYEYSVPLDDARRMLETLTVRPLVEKTRHLVDYAGHTWEIDEFAGDNQGLTVAEIELQNEAESFEKPAWIGEEVTMDPRYYNTSLSRLPYTRW